MKKVILFMSILPSFLYSQSGFNIIYEFEENPISSVLNDITSDNDTLIAIGTSFNPITAEWDLRVLKIDSTGNLLDTYKKENEIGFNMIESKIINTSDGGYCIIGNMDYQKGVVLKLNNEIEEEFFKIVYDSTNFTVLYREVVEVSDGYIIGGYIQMSTFDSQAWAMKLDYEGNEIWHRRYGAADTSEFVYAMEVMADESVMLTGIKSNAEDAGNPNITLWGKAWSIKISPVNGEVVWEKNYEIDAEERSALAMYPMLDGTYLSGGQERNSTSSSNLTQLSIRRLDNEGNLVWKKWYGPKITSDVQHVYEIFPLPDGRFVAVGHGRKEPDFTKAAITICFNPEDGEEYWTRVDTIPIDTINNGNNHVQGGTVLSSGSVVVAGYNNTGRSYGWLLKMDKNGCIQDDCETYVGVEDVREVVALPVLFPNPAESYFRIKGEHEGAIGIYSVSGRLIKVVAENLTFGEIGVEDLPKGLYFVRGRTGDRVWVLKLVR